MYYLDSAQNNANISTFFDITSVMEGGQYLGSLFLKRSMVGYPNPNTVFTVQVWSENYWFYEVRKPAKKVLS